MRHPVLTAVVSTAAAASLAFGPVSVTTPLTGTADASAGGITSGPVEYVGTLPVDAGAALGSTVHENLYIVTTPRSLSIYDTSDLTLDGLPKLLSITPLPGVAFNEEPRTDGTRLLMYDDMGTDLYLYDISDPEEPAEVTVFDTGTRQHTWACVYEDCSIVYASEGMMLDITDMDDPQVLGDWNDVEGVNVDPAMYHAIDEVTSGIVFVGTEPMYLLDAREDPANPTVIASGRTDEIGMPQAQIPVAPDQWLVSRVEWPRRDVPTEAGGAEGTGGTGGAGSDDRDDELLRLFAHQDRWGLVTIETPFAADCDEGSGPLLTYDMSRVVQDGTFTKVDEFRITESGLYVEGLAPAHTVGCFPFAFEQHPDYFENRLITVAWTEHGTRFFTIGEDDGSIKEIGWFVPIGGGANDPEWITDELVAIADLTRGVDIVRVDLDDL